MLSSEQLTEARDILLRYHYIHVTYVLQGATYLERIVATLPIRFEPFTLLQRARVHDADKLRPDMLAGGLLIQYHNKYKDIPLEPVEQQQLQWTRMQHYLHNPHHLEYHLHRGSLPSALDICEMCCDMCAVSKLLNDADFTDFFNRILCPTHVFYQQNSAIFNEIMQKLQQFLVMDTYLVW